MHDTDYPGRTPRRYVLSYRVPEKDTVIMFDPAAFYFGHFRRLTKKQRQTALRTWQDYWKQTSLFPRLFDVPFEQRTYTLNRTDNGQYKRDTIDLLQASRRDVEHALQCEIRARQSQKFKAAHLWNGEGDKELFDLEKLSINNVPFQGSVVTTAMVRADSSARNRNVPKYRQVSIDDLFGREDHFITGAMSTSEDFMWAHTKEGRTNVIVIDKHLAAVMDLAKASPEVFHDYNPKKGTAFLPFDMTHSYKHEGVRPSNPEHFPGTHPPRDVLMMDILMYWLFHGKNGGTQFSISKNLMQMPFLMNPVMITAIRSERLRFEVLTQAQATPDLAPEKIRELRHLYSEINRGLTSKGYGLEGYTLEFKGTPWETVAFNYVSVYGSARVLFHQEYAYPPLVVYKANESPRGSAVKQNEHPIRYLARRHVTVDDWTRRNRPTAVEVPDAYINGTISSDYKAAIAEHYEGGIEGLRGQIMHRYMYGTAIEKAKGAKLLALVK